MSRPRQPRATLKAVAERAGVSLSTASLVFSGRGPVAVPTAERVRRAAGELGYTGPDPRAASLRNGRSGVVGVVVEDRLIHAFRDPFAITLLDGLAEVLDAIPTGLLLVAQSPEHGDRALAHVAAMPLDALVFSLCGYASRDLVEHGAARGIPMAGTGMPADRRVHRVEIDERAAQAAVTTHLRELGHTRLGHLTMPLDGRGRAPGRRSVAAATTGAHTVSRDRVLGFVDAAGRRPLIVEARAADIESGREAARLLLEVPAADRPTGVVAQSDLLAVGVIRAAHDLGLRVPQDLSVTGFDGIALPWFDGTLTSVDQHGQAKGRALGEVVRGLLDGSRQRVLTRVPTDLRLGTTTAPPPPRSP